MGAVLVAPQVCASRSSGRTPACGCGTATRTPATRRAAAVALANLDIIEREGLLDEAARLETTLARGSVPLAEHERGRRGSLRRRARWRRSSWPTRRRAMALAKRLRSYGVATRAVGAGGIQVSPAFVMTDDQVGDLADAITAALAA